MKKFIQNCDKRARESLFSLSQHRDDYALLYNRKQYLLRLVLSFMDAEPLPSLSLPPKYIGLTAGFSKAEVEKGLKRLLACGLNVADMQIGGEN